MNMTLEKSGETIEEIIGSSQGLEYSDSLIENLQYPVPHNLGGNEKDYGKVMTDELEEAVQDVLDLDYRDFISEEGAEIIRKALQVAEEAPEASVYNELRRSSVMGLEDYLGLEEFEVGRFEVDQFHEEVNPYK